jgi:hypothetical protein
MKYSCFILLVIMVVFAVSAADAKTSYLTSFTNAYPGADGSRIDNCRICHVNANPNTNSTRNSYGIAWKNASKNFTAIENQDSDGDGFTNKVEIDAFSYPGNGADTPNSEGEGESPVEGESGCTGCNGTNVQKTTVDRILSDFLLVGSCLIVLTLLGARHFNP